MPRAGQNSDQQNPQAGFTQFALHPLRCDGFYLLQRLLDQRIDGQ